MLLSTIPLLALLGGALGHGGHHHAPAGDLPNGVDNRGYMEKHVS